MHCILGVVVSLLLLLGTATAKDNFFKRQSSNDTGYVLKKGPLDTPWTEKVGTNPWPEYPRPRLARSDWKNLNGVWQYQNASGGADELDEPPFGEDLAQPVLVPFCLESALSGVMGNFTIYSWYRTTFDVPSSWDSENRVILNFGAVDYNATVFVNGERVGNHVGGYFTFDFDITDLLSSDESNELVVFVFDPTNLWPYNIPIGKQKLDPSHIFYRPCSGIWQTVWLESAPTQHITKLDVNAGMDGQVNMEVTTSRWQDEDVPIDITIYEPHSTVVKANASGKANEPFNFTVNSPKLWSPDSPTLYNMTIRVGRDVVQSYTGFRTVSRGVINGIPRPLLNGEFIFQFGTLDQGYWPDGLHSPPSVEAMEFDLKALKEVGYNMVRKHIKVEPALFYKAADEIGLMLYQDMPSMATSWYGRPCGCPNVGDGDVPINPADQEEFDRQHTLLVEQLKSYPSIVTWIIYNEGWSQPNDRHDYDLVEETRKLDPTRLINAVSGWHDHGAGDFHDNHHYSSPQCGTPFYSQPSTPYDPKRIAFQGEFGGIGQNVTADHAWKVPASLAAVQETYELDATVEIWNYRAHHIFSELREQIELFKTCSGAVWTQTTDVEGEVNGMLTYDRRINRMDKEQWKRDIQSLYDAARAAAGNSSMVVGRGVV